MANLPPLDPNKFKLPPLDVNKFKLQKKEEPKTDIFTKLKKDGGVVSEGIQSFFPGKQVGESIGTLAGLGITAAKEKLGFTPKGATKAYDISAPKPLQVAGDIAQGALTVAAPNIGGGASVGGRIAANAALGAGLGATGAIAKDKGVGDIAKQAALGGVIGGGASALGEGVQKLTQKLPQWLTKMALPKLDTKNIPYALNNTKIGTIDTLKTQSNANISNYENSIQSILNHPNYASQPLYTPASMLGETIKKFPNSEYTVNDIVKNAQDIAPSVGKLITKFEKGTASIGEINTIRKELDKATQSVYTSLSRPPEKKMLGAALSNTLRNFVQKTAPETADIFNQYAQEVGLNKALNIAVKKGQQQVSLGDIGAGSAGFYAGYSRGGLSGGLQGAFEAILAERLLRNPSAQLVGAKLIQKSAPVTTAVSKNIFQGLKAPVTKKITGQ